MALSPIGDRAQRSAKHTLVYYFGLILNRCQCNVEMTPDMVAEIEGIVDDILSAAKEA